MTQSKSKQRPLTSGQRKFLRGKAHALKPLVLVGNSGITEGVIASIATSLRVNELIKVRFHEPEDKKAMASEVARLSKSQLCGLVGHTAILFKRNLEKPQIQLPKAPPPQLS